MKSSLPHFWLESINLGFILVGNLLLDKSNSTYYLTHFLNQISLMQPMLLRYQINLVRSTFLIWDQKNDT